MDIIRKASGKALEYAPLECNIYLGCTHGCTYCYGPSTIHKKRDFYYAYANARKDILKKLQKDCVRLNKNGNTSEILLSFVGDVYQPAEMELGLTRRALEILIHHNLPFTILTKGGTRAVRDFDLLEGYDKARFGTTLVFWNQQDADQWEPGAPSIQDRIAAIQAAYDRNIPTWVSLEPVIKTDQALQLIQELHPIVNHWKVGKLNYHKTVEQETDWIQFRKDVVDVLNAVNADYYLKKSLTAFSEDHETKQFTFPYSYENSLPQMALASYEYLV